MKVIKKYLLIILGSISFIAGLVGIFVPLLPTTPFLLLAAFCFLRSSKRLYDWLINHKIFGKYIYDYLIYKEIKRRAKISCLILLWVSITISFLLISLIFIRILLLLIGVAVSIHIMTLKGKRPHPDTEIQKEV